MNQHFKPVRPDGRALWRVLFDYIETRLASGALPMGTVLTHQTLRGLLEESELPGYRQAVVRASKELQKVHSRALQSVRNEGYCLIGGASQIEYGQAYRKRAQRSIKTGLSLMQTADRSVMSPADRNWAEKVQSSLSALVTIAKMHDEKLVEHHEAIEQLKNARMQDKKNYTATAEEVAELRRQMDEFRKERSH